MQISDAILELLRRCLLVAGCREVCGVLLEGADGKQEFFRLNNFAVENHRFTTADFEFRRARRYAEHRGLRRIAFIHSHLRGTLMSLDDERFFLKDTIPWVIVTLEADRLIWRAFEDRPQATRGHSSTT